MKKRQKTSAVESKLNGNFINHIQSPKLKKDLPSLSQDKYADKVIWDENQLEIPMLESVEVQEDEQSYNPDQSSSLFSWIEIEKKKQKISKKRKTLDESMVSEMTNTIDEDSNLTIMLDIKENIQNLSQNSYSKEAISIKDPSHFSLGMETGTYPTIAVKPSVVEDFDFEITEEDLKRIDQEINQKLSTQYLFSDNISPIASSLRSNAFNLSNITQRVQEPSVDSIIVSEEELAFFEALERQAMENIAQNNQFPGNQAGSVSYPPTSKEMPPPCKVQSSHVMTNQLAQSEKSLLNPATDTVVCLRLQVKEVFTDQPSRRKRIVSLLEEEGNSHRPDASSAASSSNIVEVWLSEDWFELPLKERDIFHLVDICDPSTDVCGASKRSIFVQMAPLLVLEVSNRNGLVIIQPDILVSPTKIAESCACLRRGVLNDKIRNFGISAPSAIMGNVRHFYIEALSERALEELSKVHRESPISNAIQLQQRLSAREIDQLIAKALAEHIEELFSVRMTDQEVTLDLQSLTAPTLHWVYTAYQQGIYALAKTLPVHSGSSLQHLPKQLQPSSSTDLSLDCSLQQITGVEESIHSPILGIKGQVDLIGKGKLFFQSTDKNVQEQSSSQRSIFLPIELKTGKWRPSTSIAHRAQVILYLLLMNIRNKSFSLLFNYSSPNSNHSSGRGIHHPSTVNPSSQYGILIYIHEKEVKVDFIWPDWNEIRALLFARNQLAKAMADSIHQTNDQSIGPRLPPMLKSSYECNYCYAAAECMMYHSALEEGNDETSGVNTLYRYIMKGINAKHLQYLKYWDKLIDLESLGDTSRRLFKRKTSIPTTNADANLHSLDFEGEMENDLWNRSSFLLEKEGKKTISMLVISSQIALSAGPQNATIVIPFQRIGLNLHSLSFPPELITMAQELLAKDLTAHPINVGDRVMVSLEKMNHLSSLKGFNEASKSLMSIDANICSGTVTKITSNELEMTVTLGHKSMISVYQDIEKMGGKEYLLRNGWFFRLDKDESNISISTMRANLMELFTEPFSPKLYLDAMNSMKGGGGGFHRSSSVPSANKNNNTNISNSKNNNTNNLNNIHPLTRANTVSGTATVASVAMSQNTEHIARQSHQNQFYRQKLRELIVDFRFPSFQLLPPDLAESKIFFYLLTPKSMSAEQYSYNLQFLNQAIQMKQQQPPPPSGQDFSYHFLPKQSKTKQPLLIEYKADDRIILPGGLIIYPGCHPYQLYQEYHQMNSEQQLILQKMVLMNDYLLIRGLPGTGKTTVLCLAIRMLIARNETILMSSYTHNAINHLLEKLLQKGMKSSQILRIGNHHHPHSHELSAASSSPLSSNNAAVNGNLPPPPLSRGDSVQSCTLESSNLQTITSLSQKIQSTRLFMTTILTASRNKILKSFKVNYCIIDEAGQITQPLVIGGLLHSDKFVLVGDEYQLSPLILNKQAAAGGMKISLLQQLIEMHPSIVQTLRIQYRMNEKIMSISNQLIYQGRMTCGNEGIRQAVLELPLLEKRLWRSRKEGFLPPPLPQSNRNDWLYQTLLPANAVVFLNTDQLFSMRTAAAAAPLRPPPGPLIRNAYEVQIQQPHRNHTSIPTTTPALSTPPTVLGNVRTRNIIEAGIIELIIKSLDFIQPTSTTSSPPPRRYSLTILTPYRAQVQLLQQLFQEIEQEIQEQAQLLLDLPSNELLSFPQFFDFEVCTIDKYQGKDSDIILLSFVLLPDPSKLSLKQKSNESSVAREQSGNPTQHNYNDFDNNNNSAAAEDMTGNILQDWKRINVAFTRAKLKLIVIGSYQMMQQNPILRQVSDYLSQRNWTIPLLSDALQDYPVQLTSMKYIDETNYQQLPPMSTRGAHDLHSKIIDKGNAFF